MAMSRGIFILTIILLFSASVSGLKITEVELNPEGTDAGNEWIELYNNGEISLEGYKIVNNDGDERILNVTFSNYFIYILDKQWLDNTDEKVFLYKNEELIDETDIFKDDANSDSTWQLCEDWEFESSTKSEENSCADDQEEEVIKEPVEEEENEEKEEEPEEADNEEPVVLDITNVAEVGNVGVPAEREIIYLTPQVIKTDEDTEELSKSFAMYGFVGFCILIGILFLIKNKKDKNEFR